MGSPCYAAEFGQFERKKVGILGGSFDPIHDGHIHLARLAKEAAALDEVWFLPCHISPHKTNRPPTPGITRLRWLEIALREIPWARIEPIELETQGPSFSYLTLEKLATRHPEIDWFWIMGGDQWAALETWRHPEKIAALADFIVLARDGAVITPHEGYRLMVVQGEHTASATAIRKVLENGTRPKYLDEQVYQEML